MNRDRNWRLKRWGGGQEWTSRSNPQRTDSSICKETFSRKLTQHCPWFTGSTFNTDHSNPFGRMRNSRRGKGSPPRNSWSRRWTIRLNTLDHRACWCWDWFALTKTRWTRIRCSWNENGDERLGHAWKVWNTSISTYLQESQKLHRHHTETTQKLSN